MKRLVMLATMLAFVLGLAASASAADLVATGSWKIAAAWVDNMDFLDEQAGADSEDDFIIEQRVRTSFSFIANENLRGVLQIEIGTSQWGAPNAGFDMGGDDVAIEVKSGYVNFVWPNTDIGVFAGLMPVALPGGPGGNPIFDDDVAAFIVSAPLTDSISVLAGWARPYDLTDAADALVDPNDGDAATSNFLDMAFLIVPMDFDGVAVTPYFAYAYSGDDFLMDAGVEGDDLDVVGGAAAAALQTVYDNWNLFLPGLMTQNMTIDDTALGGETAVYITYAGLTFDISLLDPFNLSGAFHYGNMNAPWARTERSGWLGELSLEYTGFDGVTPELYFGYSSGEDGNATGGDDEQSNAVTGAEGSSERLPVISESYGVGSFWFGGAFHDNLDNSGATQLGFWTVGLFLKDISFLEGLTHQINILYIEGTNDTSVGSQYTRGTDGGGNNSDQGVAYGSTLLENETVWEFDLNTTYQIYDQLSAVVNLGYLSVDLDEDAWTETNGVDANDQDAAKIVVGVEYAF